MLSKTHIFLLIEIDTFNDLALLLLVSWHSLPPPLSSFQLWRVLVPMTSVSALLTPLPLGPAPHCCLLSVAVGPCCLLCPPLGHSVTRVPGVPSPVPLPVLQNYFQLRFHHGYVAGSCLGHAWANLSWWSSPPHRPVVCPGSQRTFSLCRATVASGPSHTVALPLVSLPTALLASHLLASVCPPSYSPHLFCL